MGFGINATLFTGAAVGGAFAIDSDVGMMAAGGLGAFYACAMGTYGVMGVMGLAIRPFLEDEDEDEAQAQAQQQKKPQSMAHGALNQVSEFGSMGDREFQKIARR